MSSVFDAIYSAWNQVFYALANIRFFDILDIAILAIIIYKAIIFLRENRAGQLFKGIFILLVAYFVAGWWNLPTINLLLSQIVDSAIIAVAVIFQPELRRILERIGRTNFAANQFGPNSETDHVADCIDIVSHACVNLQESKTGALIVFEGKTQLGDIINTGTIIDAAPSTSIINNIFYPKSPLHDGAMIVRDGRIYAAACILPLTQREDLSSLLGTRHRAAIGMTENSDAVVLIVSEETGIISLARNGNITRNYTAASAGDELKKLLIEVKPEEKSNFFTNILQKVKKSEKALPEETDSKAEESQNEEKEVNEK